VEDIITFPLQKVSNTKLWPELVNRLSLSRKQFVCQLLTLEVMGYRKATKFLRHFRRLDPDSRSPSRNEAATNSAKCTKTPFTAIGLHKIHQSPANHVHATDRLAIAKAELDATLLDGTARKVLGLPH
jgi:hypothetical protein